MCMSVYICICVCLYMYIYTQRLITNQPYSTIIYIYIHTHTHRWNSSAVDPNRSFQPLKEDCPAGKHICVSIYLCMYVYACVYVCVTPTGHSNPLKRTALQVSIYVYLSICLHVYQFIYVRTTTTLTSLYPYTSTSNIHTEESGFMVGLIKELRDKGLVTQWTCHIGTCTPIYICVYMGVYGGIYVYVCVYLYVYICVCEGAQR